MIDLHSHILHALDDGPGSLEESIEMAILYKTAGFSRVVATPHFINGTIWFPSAKEVGRRVVMLNESLQSRGIAGIRVFAGMEIALDAGLDTLLEEGVLCGLAGNPYLLIEPPFSHLPLNWEHILFTLTAKGYRIILAHPERCPALVSDPENLAKVRSAGIFLQANADSFLGKYGEAVSSAAFHLLANGYLHLLASDSHDTVKRTPGNTAEAMRKVESFAGPEMLNLLTRINPENVMKGLPLETPPLIPGRVENRKKWLFF